MQVRDFHPSDRLALEACIAELQAFIANLDGLKRLRDGERFDAKAYVAATLREVEGHRGKVLLAEQDRAVVGCVVGIIPEQSELEAIESYPTKAGRILELVVRDGHRGAGIGVALIRAMEEYFRTEGCSAASLDVFAPNERAHRFYQRCGYSDRVHTLLKVLEPR